MRSTMKKCFCILLAAALLLTPALPAAAAAAIHTEARQPALVSSEIGGVTSLLQRVLRHFILFWQQLRALFGVGNASVRARAEASGVDLLPVPASAVIAENRAEWADAALLSPSVPDYNEIFELFGFHVGTGGLPVGIRINPLLQEEEYRLSVTKSGVSVTASGRRGIFCAAATLCQLTRNGKIAAAEVSDRPAVEYRGVIEGFYGQAWTHAFRLDLFSFMGRCKLNTYIYAPKDDLKHRAKWRELYTEDELERMRELIGSAQKNNVRFVYALSPGLDIDLGGGYSREFRLLCEKCESLYALGVRDFSILLDDIPTADAKGHAKLVNDFQREFVKTHEGCADLIMITTEYSANMLTGYTDAIAKELDPDVRVMWTGNGTIPASITTNDLAEINQKLGRKVFIWWNYPVNDLVGNDLFMGSCENLDQKLYGSISGLVSNPMNQGYASEIPLFTIADYLWNPAAYAPEASLRAALRLLAPDYAEALYTLIDLTRDTVINGNQSTFTLRDAVAAYRNQAPGAAQTLRAALENTKTNLETLSSACEQKLLEEIRPWLEKALLTVDAAILLVDFEIAGAADEKANAALSFVDVYLKASKNPKHVSPDVLTALLAEASGKINSLVKESRPDMAAVHAFTDLPTYQSYLPENAVDGNGNTFFWSSAPPAVNSTFTVDLGKVTDVRSVRLTMGTDQSFADYFHSGLLEYSQDGETYTYLCDTAGRLTEYGNAFRARYVRVRCTGEQINWVIIREFDVACGKLLPDGVSFDGSGETGLSTVFDRNLFTVFAPDPETVSGKTLTVNTADLSKVELFLPEPDGLRVYADSENGDTAQVALSRYTAIETDGLTALRIVFTDRRASIAEIALSIG